MSDNLTTQDKIDAVHITADVLSHSDDRYNSKDIADVLDTVLTQTKQVNDDTDNQDT